MNKWEEKEEQKTVLDSGKISHYQEVPVA